MLDEGKISKRCLAATIALSVLHVVTMVGTDYQAGRQHIDHSFLVNHAVFLAPVGILLLIRRACLLVGLFAIPIVIFFVLRMHHVWEFYWRGYNSMAVQKGDALGWYQIVFELLAAITIVTWLAIMLLWKLANSRGGGRGG
jgi:uncharacterized membrane protein